MTGSAPSAPDYTPIANATREQAQWQRKVAEDQLQWAKEQYADNKPYADRVKAGMLDTLDFNTETAKKDRARYEDIYQPVEDKQVENALTWDSADRKSQRAGMAGQRVASAFDAADAEATRSLESFGVDPSAVRFGALNRGSKLARAASIAGAQNKSDIDTDMQAVALRGDVINTGKGYPASISGQFGTAGSAGTAGVNAGNSTTAGAAGSLGNGLGWGNASSSSLANWGNVLDSQYKAQLGQYNAESQSNSGTMQAIGSMVGMGAMMMSDERTKENITPVGKTHDGQPIIRFNFKGDDKTQLGLSAQETLKHHPDAVAMGDDGLLRVDYKRAVPRAHGGLTRFEDGGAVPMTSGGNFVDPSMSPSGGEAIDDVPASLPGGGQARLNANEFVFPDFATQYYGTKHFQNMIKKAAVETGREPKEAQPKTSPPQDRRIAGTDQAVPMAA